MSTVRRLRVILLLAIAVTAAVTVGVYVTRSRRAARTAVDAPARLSQKVNQEAHSFSFTKTEGTRTLFKATAKKAVDYKETGKSELEDVEIAIFGNTGDRADRITSRKCEYDSGKGLIYSEGEVTIDLASMPGQVPLPENVRAATGGPMAVKTSGLLFDQKTGVATTERPLAFKFHQGSGSARGATFDSQQQVLWLRNEVALDIERDSPDDRVQIHATELRYFQRQFQVNLKAAVFKRGEQEVAADEAILYLDEQHQAKNAVLTGNIRGRDVVEGRTTDFRAAKIEMVFAAGQTLESAVASGAVHVDSHSDNGRTEVRAERLEMAFTGKRSDLKQAQWKGAAQMLFYPSPQQPRGQLKTVTAEHMEMVMKPGGAELETARTVTPGRLQLIGGGQPGRIITANMLWMQFGERNLVRQMRGEGQVRTSTEPAKPGDPLRITTSDHLVAYFASPGQQLESAEQTGNFHYQEGVRQGRGERAVYNADSGVTVLTGKPGEDPQAWEPTGRVIARRLTINEKTGETLAEQDVRATQIPQPGDKPNALMAQSANDAKNNEPVHATADRLRWDRKSGISHYEGGPGGRTRLWQGQNVLEAKTVDMEKTGKRMTADGNVFSFLVEQGKEPLRVNSEHMVYTDEDRHARYERNVVMHSQDMVVTAAVVDAWLLAADQVQAGQSRLDHAVATGKVRLDQPRRKAEGGKKAVPERHGSSERAEYTQSNDTIVLSGGNPVVIDEMRGATTGRELTYHIADDRISVVGDENVRTLTEHRVLKKSQ